MSPADINSFSQKEILYKIEYNMKNKIIQLFGRNQNR